MLTRSRALAVAVLATAAALTAELVVAPNPAAGQGLNCPSGHRVEYIKGEARCVPQHGEVPPDGGPLHLPVPAGGGSNNCVRQGGLDNDAPVELRNIHGPAEISCSNSERGQWASRWDCHLREPPTPVGLDDELIQVRAYDEDEADKALVYIASCYPSEDGNPLGLHHWTAGAHGAAQPGLGGVAQWSGFGTYVAVPPTEFDPGEPDILALWIEAINDLVMYGPQPVTAPPLDTAGLVRLPVWLWSEVAADAWPAEPLHGFAQGGTTRVDAYAEPVFMEWEMGEGRDSVECPMGSPGAAWQSGTGLDFLHPPAGACTYAYQRSSRNEPDGVFEIVAIITYRVWWYINDVYDNELELRVGRTTTFQVNELQVLTGRS